MYSVLSGSITNLCLHNSLTNNKPKGILIFVKEFETLYDLICLEIEVHGHEAIQCVSVQAGSGIGGMYSDMMVQPYLAESRKEGYKSD